MSKSGPVKRPVKPKGKDFSRGKGQFFDRQQRKESKYKNKFKGEF